MFLKGDVIKFNYINWRGEKGIRNAVIDEIYYGSNEYHPEPQFLIKAYDLDKKENRTFAMKDMKIINPIPTNPS